MPFYEYRHQRAPACEQCQTPFTVLQRISDAPLDVCPRCGAPVQRIISPPNLVSGQAHRLKESNIEKAGFTQYRKVEKGVYEKTAGKGPTMIRGDS